MAPTRLVETLRFHARCTLLGLAFAWPAHAAQVPTGIDGVFDPSADTVLPWRESGVFDFSRFEIDPGITVRFDPLQQSASLLSVEGISILGTLNAGGLSSLSLASLGGVSIAGQIEGFGGTLNVAATGPVDFGVPGGNFRTTTGHVSLQGGRAFLPGATGGVTLASPSAVPPPGGALLLLSGLGLLGWLRSRR